MDSGSYSQHRNIREASVNQQACFGRKRIPLHKIPSDNVSNYRFNATIRAIRPDAGVISLPRIIQSDSRKDLLCFLLSFFKLPIFEKCKQVLIKSGKIPAGKQVLMKGGQSSRRGLEAGSEFAIYPTQHSIQDSNTLIRLCLSGHLTAESIQQATMCLNSSELAKLAHVASATTKDLLCSTHGYLLLRCLADCSTSVFHRLSEVCLTSLSELLHLEGAVHVILHLTRSAEFCHRLLSIYEKSFDLLIDHLPAVELLNKAITQHPNTYLDLRFVMDYLNSLCEGSFNNNNLSILRCMIQTSSEPRLSALAQIVKDNIKTIIDKPSGFQAINALLLKTTNPKIISIYEEFCKQFPIQLFVRKYRKMLFLTYLQLGFTEENLINFMIDHLLKKRSNLRYVLKKEDSVWLLLGAICRSKTIQDGQINELRNLILKIVQADPSLMTLGYTRTLLDCLDGFMERNAAKITSSLNLKT